LEEGGRALKAKKDINLTAPVLARAHARGNQKADNSQPRLAFTIAEFCKAHGFSRGHFYKLKELGIAPRTMRLAGRIIISIAAAADWRRDREGAV
jgi:predicted DNA-binding transcriptional regulator AlpA